MDQKTTWELQAHILGTYFSLRVGLAAIGFALPVVVFLAGGALHHVWLEPSLSAYYHTPPRPRFFTTRDLFVGMLVAAGVGLYLYKGFSTRENIALNVAGAAAAGAAFLPTTAPEASADAVSWLHVGAALLFFGGIAYVALVHAGDTLSLLPPEARPRYEWAYRLTGAALVLSPLAAVSLSLLVEGGRLRSLVFFVETLGVWAFAGYWIVKTREMRVSQAEREGLEAELERVALPRDAGSVLPGAPPPTADAAGGEPPMRECIVRKAPAGE